MSRRLAVVVDDVIHILGETLAVKAGPPVRGAPLRLHVPLPHHPERSHCGVPLTLRPDGRLPSTEADPDLICRSCTLIIDAERAHRDRADFAGSTRMPRAIHHRLRARASRERTTQAAIIAKGLDALDALDRIEEER